MKHLTFSKKFLEQLPGYDRINLVQVENNTTSFSYN